MDRLKVDQRFYKHLLILYRGGRYAYLDSVPQLAVLLELLEDVPHAGG